MNENFLQNYRGQNMIYRLITVSQLQASGDRSAVESLIWILNNDASNDVRLAAAEALGEIGDERAVNALWEAFVNPNKQISEAAMTALDQIDARKKPSDLSPTQKVLDLKPEDFSAPSLESHPFHENDLAIPSFKTTEWMPPLITWIILKKTRIFYRTSRSIGNRNLSHCIKNSPI
jgi:hypothetical protein